MTQIEFKLVKKNVDISDMCGSKVIGKVSSIIVCELNVLAPPSG